MFLCFTKDAKISTYASLRVYDSLAVLVRHELKHKKTSTCFSMLCSGSSVHCNSYKTFCQLTLTLGTYIWDELMLVAIFASS